MKNYLSGKYHTGPEKYKSYPYVPFWDKEKPMQEEWELTLKRAFKSNPEIGLHLHFPFCERLCTFCGFQPTITSNHAKEADYLSHIYKEWKMYLAIFTKKPILKKIHLGGGTPTFFSPNNLKKLLDLLFSKSIIGHRAELSFEANIHDTSLEHLYVLKNLGFDHLILGIQDFDEAVQKTINKIQPFENTFDFVTKARLIGFKTISIDLGYGLPNQSRKSVINTIYKIRELKPDRINLFRYLHHPDKCPAQKSIEKFIPLDPETESLNYLFKEMLKESGYFEIGMEKFVSSKNEFLQLYSSNSIFLNKLGYSRFHLPIVLSLGSGAISDGWFAYTQNYKSLNKYYEALNENRLPIENGYFLNKEDLIIRKHINNLQTEFKTSWKNQEDWHPVLKKILERLNDFEKDKLIKISQTGLKIKKNGKNFITDICNAVDQRLWNESNPNPPLLNSL